MQIAQEDATASAALGVALPESSTEGRNPYSEYKLIRRNGAVVGFEPAKITVAMTKAFLAVNGSQGAAVSPRGGNANVAHMANVKNADAGANGLMFGDQPTGGRILNRHIPATEIHHFCAQTAVHGIQRCFTKFGCGGRIDGRLHKIQRKLILACTLQRVKKHSEKFSGTAI